MGDRCAKTVIPSALGSPEWGLGWLESLVQPQVASFIPPVAYKDTIFYVRSCVKWLESTSFIDIGPSWSMPCLPFRLTPWHLPHLNHPAITHSRSCIAKPGHAAFICIASSDVPTLSAWPNPSPGWLATLPCSLNKQCRLRVCTHNTEPHSGLCAFHERARHPLDVIYPVRICWIKSLNKTHEMRKSREGKQAHVYFS